ncbi:hypothetical protein ACFUCT_34150 [Streptomyces parvus]|uniref:hypothetical protein n=1 Tax=Streptomyces parvus TaxID=66428 RepID=UPI00362D1D4C
MNNKQVYGKKIFEYPLAQAIEDGRAPDYRILVPTLTDDDLRRRINLPAPDPDGEGEGPDQALRTTAPHLAVLRAMAGHGLKKVLVYFNLTSDARLFARELPHTLRQLARTAPPPRPRHSAGDSVRPRRGPPNGARKPSPASPKAPPRS